MRFYRMVGKRSFQQIQLSKDSNGMHRIARFYPKHVEVSADNGKSMSLKYHTFQEEHRTKHLCILKFEQSVSIILRLDSFVKGSLDDVHALLYKNR